MESRIRFVVSDFVGWCPFDFWSCLGGSESESEGEGGERRGGRDVLFLMRGWGLLSAGVHAAALQWPPLLPHQQSAAPGYQRYEYTCVGIGIGIPIGIGVGII